ncbi:DUF5666 domain-containing protein [Hydrogenophaga sp. A37]|uniref:DUF5666 domain-containing protein n=1 Tax=Hydrogenophaga sp. A37 TaxID=1945864 RepID=UPI00117A6A9B|nr:DUF5666 domain-containing protein [Hydrogenophaga sp. A37]
MSGLPEHEHPLGRRHWIVLALSAMAGCGGGSSTEEPVGAGGGAGSGGSGGGQTPAAGGGDAAADGGGTQVAGAPGTGGTGSPGGSDPGTGGTGIFSHGSISAFGSVVLNGIHFDETGASIRINGASSSPGALRLGMVAGVQGERYADGVSGKAESIEVWSIARGPVTAAGGGQFTVLGMKIKTQGSTFLEGVASASAIAAGQWVTVWGLQADAQASSWVATRVAVGSAGGLVVATGMVSGSKEQRLLNGIRLTGGDAEKLHSGRVTRVEGKWDAEAGSLEVKSDHDMDVRGENVGSSALVEIEGVVTSLLGGNRFTLGSVEVDASADASNYAKLKVGSKLEVYGTWQGQVLKATELEFEDD